MIHEKRELTLIKLFNLNLLEGSLKIFKVKIDREELNAMNVKVSKLNVLVFILLTIKLGSMKYS